MGNPKAPHPLYETLSFNGIHLVFSSSDPSESELSELPDVDVSELHNMEIYIGSHILYVYTYSILT